MSGNRYVREADRALRTTYEEPMGLAGYVDLVFDRPTVAAHASKYLLAAIESAGTRTVIEEGEETERYRFFDDPHNDGEHAVLGNTEMLNAFVDDLRAIAAGRGKAESIIWFAGPTATGKSELKRCLINGLREYSKTPAGRRYTIEWNLERTDEVRGLSYNEAPASDDDHWYESPVQAHPFTVFPPEVREDLLADLNRSLHDELPIRVDGRLDPFSREAFEQLEERYGRDDRTDLFSKITADQHLRVKNFVMDVGNGIGVLHAEDSGSPKERLVGSWMLEMLRALDSRGRKNPQAFSYDGVLSQGNGGVTIVEDASHHADLLQKLLNVPEEGTVKLDKGIGMDIDTQLIVISNPDLEAQLNQHADRKDHDPLKALKRRLNKLEFRYLTNLSLEVELIRRELADERRVWEAESYEALDDRIVAPLTMSIRRTDDDVRQVEFAPHALEAAGLYGVVSRLDPEDLPGDLDLPEKALLFDRGYLRSGDDRLEPEDFDFDADAHDGEHGIPVTFTRDVLADLLGAVRDRHHPDLDVEDVIMPHEVLDAMVEGLRDAPVFAASERGEYEGRAQPVEDYIAGRQADDVLDAMLSGHRADRQSVAEYVEHVYAWATGEPVETDRGEVQPDPLTMKVFEIEQLGRFGEADYEGTDPSDEVESFRRERIITSLNRHAWEHRTEDFQVGDVDFTQIPVIREVLAENDWTDVRRAFEDLDPRQWADPPSGTQTERVKADTLDTLEAQGYSRAAAELTSRRVMDGVSDRWD